MCHKRNLGTPGNIIIPPHIVPSTIAVGVWAESTCTAYLCKAKILGAWRPKISGPPSALT
jgi:hypothetical protein